MLVHTQAVILGKIDLFLFNLQ